MINVIVFIFALCISLLPILSSRFYKQEPACSTPVFSFHPIKFFQNYLLLPCFEFPYFIKLKSSGDSSTCKEECS